MAERSSSQESGVNWGVVGFGIILLMLATSAIPDTLLRVLAAAGIMALTFYWSRSRPEAEVENPVLDKLHDTQFGLDRRKYGRLRSSTDRMLEHVREMNRIAVQGREGKLAPRHTQAELDRLAAAMRDLVEDVRRSAGVPTPMEEPAAKSAQPQVVIPKAPTGPAEPSRPARPGPPQRPARPAPGPPEGDGDGDTDAMLDELEARAEAEARERARRASQQPPGSQRGEGRDKRHTGG